MDLCHLNLGLMALAEGAFAGIIIRAEGVKVRANALALALEDDVQEERWAV